MRSGVGIIASGANVSAGVDVLRDPLSNFTFAPWTVTGTQTITAARTGNGASFTGTTNRADYTIPLANESDLVTIGFAWRTNTTSATARDVISLWSDSNTTRHGRLTYNGTTNQSFTAARDTATLGTTATGLVPVNTWAYIEVQCKLGDSPNGLFIVRVNGVERLNLTNQDTKNAGTKSAYDAVRIGALAAGITCLYDDLYLSVGGAPFKGDQVIT